jgi:preprotein translocase subunit SecA
MNSESFLVSEIDLLEDLFKQKSDDELKEYTLNLKRQISNKVDRQKILVESFALVREASNRVLGLRPFNTQLLGGIYLDQGQIAEMKTGEGKTLVASLPSFLNALDSKGVHIVTVNNYLARRDQEFIGQIFRFLGLKVGLIQENMTTQEKRANYNADITYVTNSELAFDYLRDCTAQKTTDLTQRPFNYCIIDEVDSILIDEARTPLILSTATSASSSSEKFFVADSIIRCLKTDDYEVDEKTKNVTLTPKGRLKVEDLLEINNLYDQQNPWINYISNALRAHFVYRKNNDYIVADNKIFIIDEFTGRILADRRWSDGLHQSVEVKENVLLSPDSETFASITYQNFFRLYPKLSGMTGTAKTEEAELQSIYNLSVAQIPTYRPMVRDDLSDLVYIDEYAKWKAVRNKCIQAYTDGQPVLIGTSTLSKSELLSKLLNEKQIPHQLLNARPENVRRESEIVAQAGKASNITIATNMAGRGTDILLGGNTEYLSKTQFFQHFKTQCFNQSYSIIGFKSSLAEGKVLSPEKYDQFLNFYKKIKNYRSTNVKSTKLKLFNLFYFNQIYQLIYFPTVFFAVYNSNLKYIFNNLESFLKTKKQNFNSSLLKYGYEFLFNLYNQYVLKERNRIKTLGGLSVIGTERQDSRRVDNQLRGRSGRQGDKGVSQFFLSLDDRLFKLFADDNLKNLIKNLTVDEDDPIESRIVTKSLEKAQERIESLNFSARKQLFEYDEVLEEQRARLFAERKIILETTDPKIWIIECCELVIDDICLDLKSLIVTNSNLQLQSKNYFLNLLLKKNLNLEEKLSTISLQELRKLIYKELWIAYEMREEEYITLTGVSSFREFERLALINNIDNCWKKHLQKMTILKESVGWRVFAQKKPIREYKIGSYYLFKEMLIEISHAVFKDIFLIDYL